MATGGAKGGSNDRKLAFQVVFASSEDADYPAVELNVHSPQSKGWQSSRFCEYPQELGVAFEDGHVQVSQIQLLSHQSKIATRIELFVGTGADYFSATFRRLGYLSLDANERSQYKARELKSVYITAKGTFMKFIIHKCYVNPLNLFNQVGIIAINALGTPSGGVEDAAPVIPHPRAAPSAPARRDVHDLAVDMGLDPETATMLREVAARKEAAVAAEEFEMAKELKRLQDSIKAVGGQLAQLVAQKARAVEDEDYDQAAAIKQEINRIRASLQSQFESAGMRMPMPTASSRPPLSMPASEPASYAPPLDNRPIRPAAHAQQAPHEPEPVSPYAPPSHHYGDARPASRAIRPAAPNALEQALAADGSRSPETAAPKILTKAARAAQLAAEMKDESPFPASAPTMPSSEGGAGGGGRPDPSKLAGVENAADLPAPEPLSAAAEKEAGPIIDLFGEYVAQCYYSKTWSLREAAVLKMALELPNVLASNSASAVFAACIAIMVNISAKDKIAHIFVAAMTKLLPAVLENCTSGMRRGDISSSMEGLLTLLVEKIGDNTSRVREAAMGALTLLSQKEYGGPAFVASNLLRKLGKKQASSVRSLQSRLELLAALIQKANLLSDASSGVQPQTLVAYCVDNGCFAHASGDIRKATEDLFVAASKFAGPSLLGLLQPHLRPKQVEEYAAAFGGGGKPPAAAPTAPGRTAAPTTAATASAAPRGGAGGGRGGAHSSPARPAAGSKAPAPAPIAEGEEDEEGVCQFCGGCGPNATEEQLDLHYWQDCPCLMSCPKCTQIIEIATLPEHLLDECEHKADFEPCPNCGDAIPAAELDKHLSARTCKTLPDPAVANRCPLCAADIPAGRSGWLTHLIDKGCPKNPRNAKRKVGRG